MAIIIIIIFFFCGRNDTCWEFPIKTRNSEQNHKKPKSSLLFCSGTSSESKKQRQFSTTISIIQEKYHITFVTHDSTRWYNIIQRQYNGSKSGPRPDILTALLKSQGGAWETGYKIIKMPLRGWLCEDIYKLIIMRPIEWYSG